MAAKLCALNLLLAGTLKLSFNEQKTEEITNYWAIKPFKFMPKMHQNMCGRRALPRPTGELMRSPRPHSRNGGLLRRGKERAYLWGDGEKGRGPSTFNGDGRPWGKGGGKGGEGNSSPRSQGKQNKHWSIAVVELNWSSAGHSLDRYIYNAQMTEWEHTVYCTSFQINSFCKLSSKTPLLYPCTGHTPVSHIRPIGRKWNGGGVFCKKVENEGCFFLQKAENGGCFFVKKVENGGVFVKMWTFPQSRVHYVQ